MRKIFMAGIMAMLAIFIAAVIGISFAQANDTNATTVDNATGNNTNINQTNETATNTSNETTQTNASTTFTGSVNLYIMQWYPKGPDFVFVCNATGFTPTAYSWFYGDGHKLINISNQNTYHVYEALGSYTVMCIATDGNNTASDTLNINVTSLVRPVHPLFGDSHIRRSFTCRNDQTNESAVCSCVSPNENAASCKCKNNA